VLSLRGVYAISQRSGGVGETIVVTPHRDSVGDMSVQLEYIGEVTVSPRGLRGPRQTRVPFGFNLFEPRQSWTAKVFAWSDSTDPRSKVAAFEALMSSTPVLTRTFPRLDWMWFRPTIAGIPQARMAVEATARVTLPAGPHTLRTLSDDAVRVWVDGKLVIDHWAPHETMPDYATITGGSHDVRVQYVQVEGWSELRVDFLRGVVARSTGSAGPH
jgi:hypothetical protein